MNTPIVAASVTLLPTLSRGRSGLRNGGYRPHIVLGSQSQLEGIARDRVSNENYLGVEFVGGAESLSPGQTEEVELSLLYYPQVDYSAVIPGATFTVREGGSVVGYGTVLRAVQPVLQADAAAQRGLS